MKVKNLCLFLLAFLFLILETANSQTQSPFVWLIKRDGRVAYFLGTIHRGVSLEKIPCFDKVLNWIVTSDLLFVESKLKSDFDKLSEDEQDKIYIGSREERERIMSRLSLETQQTIRERMRAIDNAFKDSLPVHVQSVAGGGFEELSSRSQNFLIEHGANTEGDYADFFHFIRWITFFKAAFSFPYLDKQVKDIALFHSIEIKPLDDNKKTNEDFRSQIPSSKPVAVIDHTEIEKLIAEVDTLVDKHRENILKVVRIYKLYDESRLNHLIGESSESEEVLMKNRNQLWLKRFMKAHGEYENIFLAAGLRHFVGSHNMLDMLKEKGFSVERMTCYQ